MPPKNGYVFSCVENENWGKTPVCLVDILPEPWGVYGTEGAHMIYRKLFPGYYFHAGRLDGKDIIDTPYYRKD